MPPAAASAHIGAAPEGREQRYKKKQNGERREYVGDGQTGIHLRMMLGDCEAPAREEIDRNLDSAVRVFLAAYGAASGKLSRSPAAS
ncbi:MAG: TetR/AcrR family transcriptional regulator C-terminal domain-containing protein [Rhodomicrobium sp.]